MSEGRAAGDRIVCEGAVVDAIVLSPPEQGGGGGRRADGERGRPQLGIGLGLRGLTPEQCGAKRHERSQGARAPRARPSYRLCAVDAARTGTHPPASRRARV